ncbi:hypothetical protein SDC9_160267 [bioreactor metagenome]|uniref:Uncharacterized protein n=1 Tax=bioreactor metagenome TaxID=1076179 RepID=A0A645FF55_9ZZZZ
MIQNQALAQPRGKLAEGERLLVERLDGRDERQMRISALVLGGKYANLAVAVHHFDRRGVNGRKVGRFHVTLILLS